MASRTQIYLTDEQLSAKAGQRHARAVNPLDQSVILEMRIEKSRGDKLETAEEHDLSVREFLRGELLKCSRTTLTKSTQPRPAFTCGTFHTEYLDLVLS